MDGLADPNKTPNPAKAPWYFIGLQELLTYFNPMVAGVLGPGMAATALILVPYLDKNPSTRPEDRKFAVSFFTVFLMFWAILSVIGALFRGNGAQDQSVRQGHAACPCAGPRLMPTGSMVSSLLGLPELSA